MVRNMGVAQDLGYLDVPANLIVPLDQLEQMPATKATLISPAPRASRWRRCHGWPAGTTRSGWARATPSSWPPVIPGNENAISSVINGLTRWGAHVVHKGNAKVHVSGHASAGELVYCYNLMKPGNVMPVHGEYRHLRANADLAISTGIDADRVVLADDGVVVDLVKGRATITGKVAAGNVYVDGQVVGGVTEATLKDRRTLAAEGVVTVLAIVDADTGALTDPPDFLVRGFEHAPGDFEPAVKVVEKTLARAAAEGIGDAHQVEQMIGRDVARWAQRAFRRTPLIIPIVIDA